MGVFSSTTAGSGTSGRVRTGRWNATAGSQCRCPGCCRGLTPDRARILVVTLFSMPYEMILSAEALCTVRTGKVADARVNDKMPFHIFLREKATYFETKENKLKTVEKTNKHTEERTMLVKKNSDLLSQ